MQTVDSRPPSRAWRLVVVALAVAALGATGFIGYRLGHSRRASTPPANPAAPSLATTQLTNAIARSVPPGTLISAADVLSKLDAWLAGHPNYHAFVETSVIGGGVVGKMDVFACTNGSSGQTVKVKADLLVPQAVNFVAQRENGKLQVYFPQSNQLIEPNPSSMMASIPGLAASQTGMTALLKLARTTFAEASADLRVVTLVLNAEALSLPGASGDIYLSVRTDIDGKLLEVDEEAQGIRVTSTMRYLTFDPVVVLHDAPAFPSGKLAVIDKTFQKAVEEEARLIMNKPLGTKI